MRVKCVSICLDEQQIEKFGAHFRRNQTFAVTVGKEYLVLGLIYYRDSVQFGTGVYVECLLDGDVGLPLGWAPLCLFEVINDTSSKHWHVRVGEDGTLILRPLSFLRDYYHEDLSDDVPDVVADFNAVYELLDREDSDAKDTGQIPDRPYRQE